MTRFILIGAFAALCTVLPSIGVAANEDDGMEFRAAAMTDLVAIPEDAPAFVEPPAEFWLRSNLTADNLTTPSITVFYTGFSPEAQAAFQYAVDIWKSLIVTTVEIEIDAYWRPLAPNLLGTAGAYEFVRAFPNAPTQNWYPIALANKLAGKDLAQAYPDIVANFSSDPKLWYFGTDGRVPSGKYDFVTVVLHEIGHGLGMSGTMTVAGTGNWGTNYADKYAAIYDTLGVNGSGTNLVAGFKNRSLDLQKQLVSGSVFWGGDAGKLGANGAPPKLYAPKTWAAGSSYFHLDEATYPAGNPNALMTPGANSAEAAHSPGPIVLGMFADMGWTTSSTSPAKLGFASALGVSNPGSLMAVQPAVAVKNENGATIATDNETLITIELFNAPNGAALECESGLSIRAKQGLAQFKGCRISGGTGTSFQLAATAKDLPSAASAPFAVINKGNNRVAIPLVVHD
jgi:hypothetical protein